ncbi:MAG: transporter substrate-binding domain-containing protein [Idiomarina sp.]|nr:transporter substrate-binding domain-containing protein [Idiomarina sp.]
MLQRIFKIALFPLMLAVSALTLATLTPATAHDSGTLNFYTEDYPPFSFATPDHVDGVNTELLRGILSEAGYQAEFMVVPWGRAQRFAQTDPKACFYSAVRSPERESLYQWVGPLSSERIHLFSLNPEHPVYESFATVKNYVVGGQTADAYTDYIEAQGVTVSRVAEVEVSLQMLSTGRLDLWLSGEIAGHYMAAQRGLTLYPVASSTTSFDLWLACHVDMPETVISMLNLGVRQKQDTGAYAEILSRFMRSAGD